MSDQSEITTLKQRIDDLESANQSLANEFREAMEAIQLRRINDLREFREEIDRLKEFNRNLSATVAAEIQDRRAFTNYTLDLAKRLELT